MSVNRHPNTQGVTIKQWRYTATGGETTLSGTDGFSQSLTYTPGAEEVFVNGVLLVRGTDYTASTGTTVVLNNALVAGDIATVSAPSVFNVANSIPSSTVTAKGDLLVANGSASLTNLAVGADGSTLVANSSAGGGVSWAGPQFVAGRNKIINGDFGIWQRGTSFSNSGNYTADRWYWDSDATVTISQQAFTAGAAPVAGYEAPYFFRIAKSAGGTYVATRQRVEDVRTFANQTVTLSFWAKANATVTINPYYQQNFGSGGSTTTGAFIGSGFTLTTSWVRYSATVAIPSVAGMTIGTGSYLEVFAGRYVGSAATTIDIWGVQLEAGSVATPFTTATGTLQGELAACQRYYWRTSVASGYGLFGFGYGTSGNQAYVNMNPPVTMRTVPSSILDLSALSTFYWEGSAAGNTPTSLAYNTNSTPSMLQVTVVKSGSFTSGGTCALYSYNQAAYIGFNAEL